MNVDERVLRVTLSDSIGDISISYMFEYKDNDICGKVSAIASDSQGNSLGTISSYDGVKFSSGLYFGYGDNAGEMLTKAKSDILEIFNNTENYI
jgi:hypothetical protein